MTSLSIYKIVMIRCRKTVSGAPKNGDLQSAEDTDQITQCLGACMTLGKKTAFPEGFNEGTAV